MKKRCFISFILVLVLVLSFGFSACFETTETPHEHSWSTEWSRDDEYHWYEPLCNHTAELKDFDEHNFVNGVCSECGYTQRISHEHSWSTEWSKDEEYHWHESLCNDTTETKDRAEHDFEGDECSVCGYHIHSWSTEWSADNNFHWHNPLCDDTTEVKDKKLHSFNIVDGVQEHVCSVCGFKRFKDVGEKYDRVVQPLYDAAETILYDLIDHGHVVLNGARNPRISSIRFTYGTSFIIFIHEDIYVAESGEKCEFLQKETGITLKNFSESNSEIYLAYREFLRKERDSQNLPNYEEFILPYAQKSAAMILARYNIYKNSRDREISIDNYGKQINLSADSSLSETYEKIVANLNTALEKRGCPLITNQALKISFGGNINWEIVHRWIIIEVSVGSMNYSFYLSFNEDGEFSADYINHVMGTLLTGYEWSDPDMFNALNEEYAELFGRLKIEEYDLSDIRNFYKYDGVGCGLYDSYSEDTHLYF